MIKCLKYSITLLLVLSVLALLTPTQAQMKFGDSAQSTLLAITSIDLGSTTKPFRNLFLYGAGTYGTNYFKFDGTPTSTRTITIPDVTATMVAAATSTTTTQALFATSTAGAPAYRALVAGDLPATAAITIASGTKALATSAISSATCTSAQTATATGTLSTDIITASFNGDPTAVTGFVPLTAGMLTLIVYPTTDTFNVKECNNTGSSITPGAITLNWRVTR